MTKKEWFKKYGEFLEAMCERVEKGAMTDDRTETLSVLRWQGSMESV